MSDDGHVSLVFLLRPNHVGTGAGATTSEDQDAQPSCGSGEERFQRPLSNGVAPQDAGEEEEDALNGDRHDRAIRVKDFGGQDDYVGEVGVVSSSPPLRGALRPVPGTVQEAGRRQGQLVEFPGC